MNYYIDLGSSTIKVYCYLNELKLIEEHSIHFKDGFSCDRGFSSSILEELFAYFDQLVKKYSLKYENTFIYATGIFRNLSDEKQCDMLKEFNSRFDLHFNIISHGIENYYLGCAMQNDYRDNKVLIINMGGKTTELVTFVGKELVDRKNLNVGVGDILNVFCKINEKYSEEKIEEIEEFVSKRIGDISLDSDYDCAIFTGGEERFEKLTGFHLVQNTLFDDGIHNYMISIDDYIKDTEKVFYKMSMDELYQFMPCNPKWMDGARAGAVLPLVLFKMAHIQWIVPSDLNLIHGVIHDCKNL